LWKGSESEEVVTVCYSYKDRQMEEEARRKAWEQEQRRRREEWAKKDEKERAANEDRGLVKA